LTGVEEYSTDLETQTVKVKTTPTLSYDDVKAKIGKTGKEIVSGKEVDGF